MPAKNKYKELIYMIFILQQSGFYALCRKSIVHHRCDYSGYKSIHLLLAVTSICQKGFSKQASGVKSESVFNK